MTQSITNKKLFFFLLASLVGALVFSVLFTHTPARAIENATYNWESATKIRLDYNRSCGLISCPGDGKESVSLSGSYPTYTAKGVVGDASNNPEMAVAGCMYTVTVTMTTDSSKGSVKSESTADLGCDGSPFNGEISVGQTTNAPADTSKGTSGTAEGEKTSCKVDGVGWIVCSLSRWVAQVVDGIYGLITIYLVTPAINTNIQDESNALYNVWAAMRNLANVAFVIAFMIIIYSQLSGVGVSNYGIKKLLPKIIVSAILVNVSYWIAAIAVDLSNIIGSGVYNLIKTFTDNMGAVKVPVNIWEMALTTLLGGGGLAVAGGATLAIVATASAGTIGMAVLWVAIPAVLTAVLAVIVAFAVLAARQALTVILIVLSPLAFVALLLPNTEHLFNAWRKSLMTMLIFYPIFSVLFAGAQLASLLILATAAGGTGGVTDKPVGHIIVLALFIQVIPLIMTPLLIKFSGGLIGRLAGIVNSKSKGLIDRSAKIRDRKLGLLGNEAMGAAAGIGGRNPFARTARFMGRMYRRSQNDTRADGDRQKIIDAQNQTSYLSTGRAEQLSTALKNAQQKVQMEEAEHNVAFEVQKDADVTYRINLANAEVDVSKQQDQKRYKETLSTSQFSSDPLIQRARDAEQSLNLTRDAINSADRVLKQEYATELKNSPGMAQYAGGIEGAQGATRVRATAQSTVVQAFNDAVKAEKVTMSHMDSSQLFTEMQNTSLPAERRAAAAGLIPKVGGADDIMNAVDEMGKMMRSGDAAAGAIQQQFHDDLGGRKPTSMGAQAMTNMGLGRFTDQFDNLAASRVHGGKLTGADLASTPVEEIARMATVVAANKATIDVDARRKLADDIHEYLTSAQTEGRRPSAEITAQMEALESTLR